MTRIMQLRDVEDLNELKIAQYDKMVDDLVPCRGKIKIFRNYWLLWKEIQNQCGEAKNLKS